MVCVTLVACRLTPFHLPAEDDYFVGGDCDDGDAGDDEGGNMTNGGGAGDGESGEPMETGQFDDPDEE